LDLALDRMRAADYAIGETMVLGDLGDHARDLGDLDAALGFYRDALRLGQASPGARMLVEAIEGIGVVSVAVGQVRHGAMLLGAAELLRERLALQYRVPENDVALQQAVTAAQAVLGAEALAEAWQIGRWMTLAAAIAASFDVFSTTSGVLALTPREREILAFVAAGETDAAIADRLFLSVRTVENHVAHIRAKLGVASRRDIAIKARISPVG
ncbi:MAG: LuxR C-terminal-related transcriptional regulator, partial [Thermomicrobiales bacterium]